MQTLPTMPTPTLAAWIMLTSLPPSPVKCNIKQTYISIPRGTYKESFLFNTIHYIPVYSIPGHWRHASFTQMATEIWRTRHSVRVPECLLTSCSRLEVSTCRPPSFVADCFNVGWILTELLVLSSKLAYLRTYYFVLYYILHVIIIIIIWWQCDSEESGLAMSWVESLSPSSSRNLVRSFTHVPLKSASYVIRHYATACIITKLSKTILIRICTQLHPSYMHFCCHANDVRYRSDWCKTMMPLSDNFNTQKSAAADRVLKNDNKEKRNIIRSNNCKRDARCATNSHLLHMCVDGCALGSTWQFPPSASENSDRLLQPDTERQAPWTRVHKT